MTVVETRPSAFDLRPLSGGSMTIGGVPSAVATRHPSLRLLAHGFSTKCADKRANQSYQTGVTFGNESPSWPKWHRVPFQAGRAFAGLVLRRTADLRWTSRASATARRPRMKITVNVDGVRYDDDVEPRLLLVHYLREQAGRTGTPIGCDTTNCGACTVLMNGVSVKSCSVLAVQADGAEITTIQGLADGTLHPLQQAFHEEHALQCGYCTPGMIMAAADLLKENPHPTEEQVREGLEGNLCRCTGYQNIVRAVLKAAQADKTAGVSS